MTIKTDNQQSRPAAWTSWVACTGLFLIMAATALPLLRFTPLWWKWLYVGGAALAFVGRAFGQAGAPKEMRARRLVRMQLWSAIIFCVGAFFLFYRSAGPTDWLAFTLAGGALQCYASVMLPRALRSKS